MLGVSEIFYSLQGEGEFIGVPSVFVRLGGCNLKCEGFGNSYENTGIIGCDSIYAANARFSKEWSFYQNSKDLICEIESLSPLKSDIIITGGEPTLQFKNPILLESIDYFMKQGRRICVESNGSVDFAFDDVLRGLYFTLSVKLSNSAEAPQKRIRPQAIQNIIDNAKSTTFKFVLNAQMCEDGSAIREIKDILCSLHLKNNRVYLMPQGTSVQELDTNISKIYPICLKEGFYLTDRIHIRIWGDKRGV